LDQALRATAKKEALSPSLLQTESASAAKEPLPPEVPGEWLSMGGASGGDQPAEAPAALQENRTPIIEETHAKH